MDNHVHTNDTPNTRRILEAQLRECYGRVIYTHKTHEKCADILLSRFAVIKVWQIILSAITTGGFIAAIFDTGKNAVIIGSIVSTILLVLNAYTKNQDLGELGQKHRRAATDLWLIREQYLSLITDLVMGEKPVEKLQSERDRLLKQLYSVYGGVPSTNYKAYKKAQDALQKLEELTFSDAEIDAFMPTALKMATRDGVPS